MLGVEGRKFVLQKKKIKNFYSKPLDKILLIATEKKFLLETSFYEKKHFFSIF